MVPPAADLVNCCKNGGSEHRTLRCGHVAGRFDVSGELSVSHIVPVHSKVLDIDKVSRRFVKKTLLVIGFHQKPASLNPDHSGDILPVNLTPGRLIRIRARRIGARHGSA